MTVTTKETAFLSAFSKKADAGSLYGAGVIGVSVIRCFFLTLL